MVILNTEETMAILNMLNANYAQTVRNFDSDTRKSQLKLWSVMFVKDEPEVVAEAVTNHIRHSKFYPTVAEIKEQVRKLTMPDPKLLLKQMIQCSTKSTWHRTVLVARGENGRADTYANIGMEHEAFLELPEILQRFIGTADRLKAWGMAWKADSETVERKFLQDIVLFELDEHSKQTLIETKKELSGNE